MALISAYTILRSVSLFHIVLAWILITNPKLIANQNIVFIMGESMHIPAPRGFDKPSAPLAFLGLVLGFLGISDLTALSMSDDIVEQYWGTQTPVRLTMLFGITGYTYLFKEGGMFGSKTRNHSFNAGDDLKNSIVFTWGFLEMTFWFWIFISLRDERRQRSAKLIEQRKKEAQML